MKRKFVIVAVIGTVLVAFIALAAVSSQQSRETAATLEELRKEATSVGLPLTMDEVPLPESVRPEDNAANRLADAVKASGNERLDLLVQAGLAPACKFDWKPQDAENEIKRLDAPSLVGVIVESMGPDLANGRPNDARRKLRAALRLARHFASYPSLHALEASVMAERRVFEHVGKLMASRPDDQDLMPIVQAECFTARPLTHLAVALRTFAATGHEVATKREIDGTQKIAWLWSKGDFPTDPWGRAAVEAKHLEQAILLAERLKPAVTWNQARREIEDIAKQWSQDKLPESYTLRESARSITLAPTLATENEAARRILFVAASAFRYYHENSRFPAECPVRGEMANDPFTGEPMRFSNPGNGFWIHSIGADAISEGATTEPGLKVGSEIAFSYAGRPIE